MSESVAHIRSAGPVTAAVIDDAIRLAEARRHPQAEGDTWSPDMIPEAVFGSADSWERGFFVAAGAIAALSGAGRWIFGIDALLAGPAASALCVSASLGAAIWMAGRGKAAGGRKTVRAALIMSMTALALTVIAAAGFAG